MNEQVHFHDFAVMAGRRNITYHDREELAGLSLHLVYGDTMVRVAWCWQGWQLWNKEKLERKIRAAATKAMEKHDASMVKTLQLRSSREVSDLATEIGGTLVAERKTEMAALTRN